MFLPSAAFRLRNLLLADAATCAGMGLLLALGSEQLGRITHIPTMLLTYVGISLFPVAIFMIAIALRSVIPAAGAWLVIAGNAAWVAGSFLLLLSGWISPNAVGTGFIVVQALAVAVLTKLEHSALGRAMPSASPG